MNLYLVQHGDAVAKERDPTRPLTEQGRRDVEKIAGFLKGLNLSVQYLWHSGKARAAQTAEILATAIEPRTGIARRDGLGPNDDVRRVAEQLASIDEDIMIVGHLPFLSKLASLLITEDESANTVTFRQGGIVRLSRSDQQQWQLAWMLTPQLFL